MDPAQAILLGGYEQIWKNKFGFALSMAVKCAVELDIPDILHSNGTPMSLSHIAKGIDSPSVNLSYLARIMRVLSEKRIFTSTRSLETGETLYELPESSRWLLKDSETSLVPFLIFMTDPWLQAPWHYFGQCVKDGGVAFKKAHNGQDCWGLLSQHPDFNNMYNRGLACLSKLFKKSLLDEYKDGFSQIKSLVDVGAGNGGYAVEVVKSYPHIKGIIFDLPHVIAMAPTYDRITLVGGDMFESVPSADAIFMKNVLHDWTDEDCIRILKNCRKALDEKTGRVIIVELMLQEEGNGNVELALDLMMFAHTTGGKERTELEFRKILEEAGFPRYKIIPLLNKFYVIEGFLQ